MDDFVFRGRDIAQFHATAAFGAAMKTGAKITRSAYELPGGGSVVIGEDSYAPTAREVTILPEGVTADAAWARDILDWLMAGRGEFTLLSDPDVMRIAEFDGEATYGEQIYPGGAIKLTMTLQPLAYDAHPTQTSASTQGGIALLPVKAGGEMEMPLRVEIACTSGTITAVDMTAGVQSVHLEGLNVVPGQTIVYDAGQLLGDVMTMRAAGAACWHCVRRWARLAARRGESVTVTLTGGEATVTVCVRGRYPA